MGAEEPNRVRKLTPMISIAATTGLLETLGAAGVDPDRLLRSVGLDSAIFRHADGFIQSSQFARLLEECAFATGDDCFGLHLGERFNPKNIGPLIYVVLNAPTIAAGFENAARYMKIHNEALRVSLRVDGDHAYLEHALADMGIPSTRQNEEYGMTVSLNAIRLIAGSDWSPQEVRFAHELQNQTSEHLRIFRAPAVFGCETNALVTPREFVDRQVPAADQRLYPILKRYIDRILSEMPREDSFLASIRKAIAEELRDREPKLARVAARLALGTRTLQRRLKEYGVEFKTIADDTRRRLALKYLTDREHTLTEVAFLLGYSDVSAFNRAFRRWTHSTPTAYRRKNAG